MCGRHMPQRVAFLHLPLLVFPSSFALRLALLHVLIAEGKAPDNFFIHAVLLLHGWLETRVLFRLTVYRRWHFPTHRNDFIRALVSRGSAGWPSTPPPHANGDVAFRVNAHGVVGGVLGQPVTAAGREPASRSVA